MEIVQAPTMIPRLLLSASTAALFGLLLISTTSGALADAEGDLKKRVKTLERELDRSRDKLHEAQRELAAKADHIEALERELKDRKERGKDSPKRERKVMEKEGRDKTTAKRPPSPPKPGIPAQARKEESPARVATSAPSYSVTYAAKSAVNYEGREEALAWAKEQLRAHPEAKLKFEGRANDSEYPEVNRLIATNRARYLADYLRLSGIPAAAIGSVSGAISKEGDPKGKRCEVSLEDPKKPDQR